MTTILVVDDSRFQQSFIGNALAPAGYEVLFAGNGREALDLLAGGQQVDAVVADLIMPEMRGMAMLDELRRQGMTAPVVIVTADIQEHVREECLEHGAQEVLHKPVQADLLRRTLAELLESEVSPLIPPKGTKIREP